MKTVWSIYGIFSQRKKECLYVGLTKNPYYRELDQKRSFGRRAEFRIFIQTKSRRKAALLESKYIREYRQVKQAKFNTNGVLPRCPKCGRAYQ